MTQKLFKSMPSIALECIEKVQMRTLRTSTDDCRNMVVITDFDGLYPKNEIIKLPNLSEFEDAH